MLAQGPTNLSSAFFIEEEGGVYWKAFLDRDIEGPKKMLGIILSLEYWREGRWLALRLLC